MDGQTDKQKEKQAQTERQIDIGCLNKNNNKRGFPLNTPAKEHIETQTSYARKHARKQGILFR